MRASPTAPDLHRLLARDAILRPLQVCQSRKQLVDRSLPRVYVAHRGLNVIVSSDILQRKGVRVLTGLGTKLRSTPTAGCLRLPRGHAESLSRGPHSVHCTGERTENCEPRVGTIESIDGDGRLRLKMDDGRTVELDPRKCPHLDYGYAMTSHSSQGQTADRVLIHVDTELGAKDLLNSRMAYVSVSRGAHDAQFFTNDREELPVVLGHDVSRQSAHAPAINHEHTITPQQEISKGLQQHSVGLGLGF